MRGINLFPSMLRICRLFPSVYAVFPCFFYLPILLAQSPGGFRPLSADKVFLTVFPGVPPTPYAADISRAAFSSLLHMAPSQINVPCVQLILL